MPEQTVEIYDRDGNLIGTELVTVSQEAVDRLERDDRLTGAIDTLRSWAADARATEVTSGNAVQVLDVVVTRLGVFFDRFADLLENR